MAKGFYTKRIHSIWGWLKSHVLVILIPALLLCVNHFFYILARLISHNIWHSPDSFLDVAIPGVDNKIMLNGAIAWMAIPYISAYLYWLIMTFVVYHTLGAKNFWRLIGGALLMNIICFFIWAFVPTKQNPQAYLDVRKWIYGISHPDGININPDLHGIDKFNASIMDLFYRMDSPDNLLPSGHNSCTFIIFMMYWFKNDKGKRNWIGFGFTLSYYLLIAASTLCTKQHCLMDLFAGISVSVISLFLSDFLKLGKHIQKWTIRINSSILHSYVQIRHHKVHLLTFIVFISVWLILVGFGIYFGIVCLLTGDPFKAFWSGGSDAWSPDKYFPANWNIN